MTVTEAINCMNNQCSPIEPAYVFHRYWRLTITRCYIFMGADLRFDSVLVDPRNVACFKPDNLEGSFGFVILPWTLQDSDKWQVYSYKALQDDYQTFPEGDAFR